MANLMFIRKAISLGRGLVVVSLPKSWRMARGVERGCIIQVEVLSDGSLRITPMHEKNVELKSKTINEANNNET